MTGADPGRIEVGSGTVGRVAVVDDQVGDAAQHIGFVLVEFEDCVFPIVGRGELVSVGGWAARPIRTRTWPDAPRPLRGLKFVDLLSNT